MSLGRGKDRRPGRRRAFRTPKPRILVVCEGAKTEPQYFQQFVEAHRDALVDVETVGAVGVPLSVVREASKRKRNASSEAQRTGNRYLAYDSVWAAIDRDEHPNFEDALEMARRNGVQTALSNPCFELWLFLHFSDEPGAIERDEVKRRLRAFLPRYDKSVDFRKEYSGGYAQAVTRAKRLDQIAMQMKQPGRNPTTSVYKLTESILPPSSAEPAGARKPKSGSRKRKTRGS